METVAALVAFAMCALVAAFPLWMLVRGVRRGALNSRGIDVHRTEQPVAFWFMIVILGAIAAAILSFPLHIAWGAFKPLVAQDRCLDSGGAWHDGRCVY